MYSQILLTSAHKFLLLRNKLLIKSFVTAWSVHKFSSFSYIVFQSRYRGENKSWSVFRELKQQGLWRVFSFNIKVLFSLLIDQNASQHAIFVTSFLSPPLRLTALYAFLKTTTWLIVSAARDWISLESLSRQRMSCCTPAGRKMKNTHLNTFSLQGFFLQATYPRGDIFPYLSSCCL